jgi:purine-binding chemotaxis protein CheW
MQSVIDKNPGDAGECCQHSCEAVTFDLLDDTFALPASLVLEIIDPLPETDVPGSAPLIGSVANFRGQVIPLADLRRAFGLAPAAITTDSRIIVLDGALDGASCLIGIKADRVHEVTTIDPADCEPPPRIGMRWRQDTVQCLIKYRGSIVVVPNLQKIFSEHCNRDSPSCEHCFARN